jgi:2-hydroxychromene-2-carboxylate isomerase
VAHIDYYASLNSPWTHLGAARIEALAAKHGASLRIFPVDFGTVFAGSGGLPLPRRAPQRQAYRLMELRRWRDFLGVPITIEPKHFPASEALTDAVMRLGAEPRWTERRVADTQAALARGVFGAPSYVIGDEIFWGQDRLDFVDRKLAGLA